MHFIWLPFTAGCLFDTPCVLPAGFFRVKGELFLKENSKNIEAALYHRLEMFQKSQAAEDFRHFCSTLLAAPLLALRHADGKGLALLNTQTGDRFIPSFTSQEELGKWTFPQKGKIAVTFDMLNHIVVDDRRLSGIVLNPFGKQIVLRREQLSEIQSATRNMTVNRVDHTGSLIFEAARNCPPNLDKALAIALALRPEVFEAYILLAREEHEENTHLLFLIDFNGDRKLLFPYVAEVIQPYMKPGQNFELFKATYQTLQMARTKSVPVYKRQTKLSIP